MPTGLSTQSRLRALIPLVEGGLRKGQSLTSIYQASKNTELGVRKQTFLNYFRNLRDLPQRERRARYTRHDRMVSHDTFVPSKTFMSHSYSWTHRVQLYNPKTHETFERYIVIGSDSNRIVGELNSEARDLAIARWGQSAIQIRNVNLDNARMRFSLY